MASLGLRMGISSSKLSIFYFLWETYSPVLFQEKIKMKKIALISHFLGTISGNDLCDILAAEETS